MSISQRRLSRLLLRLSVITLCLIWVVMPSIAQEPITLDAFTNDSFGLQSQRPATWTEAGPGVYARGQSATDSTSLIIQAAPVAPDQLLTLLQQQLGLPVLPEASDTLEASSLTWMLYAASVEAEGQSITADIALAEQDGSTYVVVLITTADERDALFETLFQPIVASTGPIVEGETEADDSLYTDPSGLFSVPIPTNWILTETDSYIQMAAPDDTFTVRILMIETDDPDMALVEAWATVDPDFELEYDEDTLVDVDDPNVTQGLDRIVVATYADGSEGQVTQGAVRVFDGISYVSLFDGDLETVQRRSAQISEIDTGFEILAVETVDLSAVEPLPVAEILPELETYIEEFLAEADTPGAAVAIVADGEMIYSAGFGVRSIMDDTPLTPDTLMMIGSTTKPMTTMMMASLVDDGLLDWDAPVVSVLPEFSVADPDLTETITVANLVCACTGVPRRDFELIFNAADLTAEDVVASLGSFEFFTDFGEAFQYSNQLVATGGYVAAAADGAAFGDLFTGYQAAFQARILDPLGMSRSTFDFDAVTADGNFATPHSFTIDGEVVAVPLSVEATLQPVGPAGSMWSTAEEMTQFMLAAINAGSLPDGTQIASAESFGRTQEPQVTINADTNYGLGWFLGDYKGVPTVSHGGNTLGFTSDFAYLPDYGIGIVVLTNEQGSITNTAISSRFFELLFEQEFEFEATIEALRDDDDDDSDPLENLEAVASSEAIETFVGEYRSDVLGDMTITVDADGTLVLDVGEFATRLYRNTETADTMTYVAFDPPFTGLDFTLSVDEAGDVTIEFGAGVSAYSFLQIAPS